MLLPKWSGYKKQNFSRRTNIIDDIVYAESKGICVTYGYLFDPRTHTVGQMKAQIAMLERPRLPMSLYFSLIVPIAGTALFWDDIRGAELRPNLFLRDFDGETITYSHLADKVDDVTNL
jgi:hypothetical protein